MSDDLKRRVDRILSGRPVAPPEIPATAQAGWWSRLKQKITGRGRPREKDGLRIHLASEAPPPAKPSRRAFVWAVVFAALATAALFFSLILYRAWVAPVRLRPALAASWPTYARLFATPAWTRQQQILSLDTEGRFFGLDLASGHRIFEVSVGSPGLAPVLLADLRGQGVEDAVLALADGSVSAFRSDGVRLWKTPGAARLSRFLAKPVFHKVDGEGRVLVVDESGQVFCLESAYGHVIWSRLDSPLLRGDVFATPLFWGDRWILAGRSGQVVALDARDGRTLWSSSNDQPIRASPLSIPEGVLLIDEKGRALVFRKNGEIVSRAELKHPVVSSPAALDGGRWAVGTADGKILVARSPGAKLDFEISAADQEGFLAPLVAVDLNGDGVMDLVALTGDGRLYLVNVRRQRLFCDPLAAADGATAQPLVGVVAERPAALVASESGSLRLYALLADPDRAIGSHPSARQFLDRAP